MPVSSKQEPHELRGQKEAHQALKAPLGEESRTLGPGD
jgi:hypothetical protein